MIKVNQITQLNQLAKLPKEVVVGLHITKEKQSHSVDLALLSAIRSERPEAVLSLSFDASQFPPEERAAILSRFNIQYYEFTPVDFYKKDAFEAELRSLEKIEAPKVANGFFVESDDHSFLKDRAYFSLLREQGVAYFQFELDSPSKRTLGAMNEFAAQYPCLITDSFESLDRHPVTNRSGIFLNIENRDKQNYDYSLRAWPFSRIVRMIKGYG